MYRLLKIISGVGFRLGHWAQWQSTKFHSKTHRKRYLTNVVGYAYDYLVGKIQQLKAERKK
jgi:hypothetical protein